MRSVIGITPKGKKVFFNSLTAASIAIGVSKGGSIHNAIEQGHKCCGWDWYYAEPWEQETCVPFAVAKDELVMTKQSGSRRRTLDQMLQSVLPEHARKQRDTEPSRIQAISRRVPTLRESVVMAKIRDRQHLEAIREEDSRRAHYLRIVRGPHTYGICESFNCFIKLPVSGTVLSNSSRAEKRFREELEGRDWIKHCGVYYVAA